MDGKSVENEGSWSGECGGERGGGNLDSAVAAIHYITIRIEKSDFECGNVIYTQKLCWWVDEKRNDIESKEAKISLQRNFRAVWLSH